MRVTLTKRLGQNRAGTVIDTTITQARWMFEHGVATAAPEEPETDEPTDDTTDGTDQQETSASQVAKQTRGRRSTKPSAKPDSGE